MISAIQLPLFPTSKPCSACHIEQPLSEFHKKSCASDGLASQCKSCNCASKRRNYARDKERILERAKNRQPNTSLFLICCICHTEKSCQDFYKNRYTLNGYDYHCKECEKNRRPKGSPAYKRQIQRASESQKRNIDKHREYTRRWNMSHREHMRMLNKRNYEANKQERYRKNLIYREQNIDRYREYYRNFYKRNREKVIEKSRVRQLRKKGVRIGKVNYARILVRDKCICHICGGKTGFGSIHFDHVIPIARGGSHTEDNIKVSHSICNLRKGKKLLEEMTPYLRRGIT